MLDHGDDIGCVTAAGAFCVVSVDGASVDGFDRGLDEAGLVEGICVDEHLDV